MLVHQRSPRTFFKGAITIFQYFATLNDHLKGLHRGTFFLQFPTAAETVWTRHEVVHKKFLENVDNVISKFWKESKWSQALRDFFQNTNQIFNELGSNVNPGGEPYIKVCLLAFDFLKVCPLRFLPFLWAFESFSLSSIVYMSRNWMKQKKEYGWEILGWTIYKGKERDSVQPRKKTLNLRLHWGRVSRSPLGLNQKSRLLLVQHWSQLLLFLRIFKNCTLMELESMHTIKRWTKIFWSTDDRKQGAQRTSPEYVWPK